MLRLADPILARGNLAILLLCFYTSTALIQTNSKNRYKTLANITEMREAGLLQFRFI